MTVYELIQELVKCRADAEIGFSVDSEFECDVEVDLDGDEVQTVDVDIDEDATFHKVSDYGDTVYIELK